MVWTDGSSAEAQELVQTMEHLRQVIYGVSFFRPPATPAKFIVIALANAEEVHAYVPEQFIAFATPGNNALMQPVIVLPIDHLDHDRRIITHELTHAISYAALPQQPHWFAEGLASYFETVRLDEHKADVGMPEQFNIRELRSRSPVPISQLITCDRPACMDNRFYTTVWALFTFMANQHPNELLAFIERLSATPSRSTAWPPEFTSEPLDRIDHDLANWLAYGKTVVSEYNLKLADAGVTERALGDGDALAARAVVHGIFVRTTPPEVDAALAVEPTNVVAATLKEAHDRSLSPEAARALVAAHPEDWRAWWLLARAAHDHDAAAKMCELVAKNPAQLPHGACP